MVSLWQNRESDPGKAVLYGLLGMLSLLLLVAVAILGVGHIGIHLQHRREAMEEG